jgi:hypothetical protein
MGHVLNGRCICLCNNCYKLRQHQIVYPDGTTCGLTQKGHVHLRLGFYQFSNLQNFYKNAQSLWFGNIWMIRRHTMFQKVYNVSSSYIMSSVNDFSFSICNIAN